MPVRFRKSFKIFPGVKVNLSKSGMSFTVGTKGYHLNFSNRGVKQTVGLPGSGISQSEYLIKNDTDNESVSEKGSNSKRKRKAKDRDEIVETPRQVVTEAGIVRRRTPGWVLLLGLVVVYLGALVLGIIPANFLSQALRTLLEWSRSVGL